MNQQETGGEQQPNRCQLVLRTTYQNCQPMEQDQEGVDNENQKRVPDDQENAEMEDCAVKSPKQSALDMLPNI